MYEERKDANTTIDSFLYSVVYPQHKLIYVYAVVIVIEILYSIFLNLLIIVITIHRVERFTSLPDSD